MTKKTTTQKLAELKTLAKGAKENLFRRIQLAAEVLDDTDWIARTHGGSDLKAQDAIQDDYFSEIGGLITLGNLLAVYRAIPDEKTWAEYKYDIAAVQSLAREQEAAESGEEKSYTNWKKRALDYEGRIEEVENDARRAEELCDRKTSEVEKLNARILELERENANLRGRIEELEKLANVCAAAVA